jgi:basic amino acid/polyamine antiporter, APA family
MPQLQRTLSLNSTIAIVIGGVIGSGIFMKPATMAAELGSPIVLMSVWLVAGIMTLFGALSNAEVATLFPETGGQFVFFQKMYGEKFAFVYGWASLMVFNTAGNASIAYVFAQYADYFLHLPQFAAASIQSIELHLPFIGSIFPLENFGVKMLTIVLLTALTMLNYFSIQNSAALQRILTAMKTVAIFLLISSILFSGKGTMHHFAAHLPNMPTGLAFIGAYVAALAGAFWAYDGWNNISFIAGEIKAPQSTIPKSLFIGLSTCIIVYLLVNLSFVYIMPIEAMAKSAFIASDAGKLAWGTAAGAVVALLVMLSTFGTTNANVLGTARVTFALGKDNRLLQAANKVHPKFQTPGNALLFNLVWSIVLIISGSFDMLTDMLIFVSWFFYGMSALGVFVLRKKMPNAVRAYKVWGYPVVPFLFVLFTTFFLVMTVYKDILNYQSGQSPFINSVFGILITLTGLPMYYLSKKKKSERVE